MSVGTLQTAVGKAMWRLVPMAMLLFFFSLLDRTNISFAALEMNKDLGLSPTQYGTAAGIFFVGYFLFEIPSNFMLQRTGARLWLARIMVTWGLVVMAMAFIQGVGRSPRSGRGRIELIRGSPPPTRKRSSLGLRDAVSSWS